MHMQMPDRIVGENVEPEQKVPVGDEVLESGFRSFELVEDVRAELFVDGGGWGSGVRKDFAVLVVHGAFGASEDLRGSVLVVPKVDEMCAHFFEQGAVVCGGVRVDDVVDAGFGDDEGVGEALALGGFAVGRFWVLAAVVGGDVADDVGVGGFAEDEGWGVAVGVLLFVWCFS